MELQKGWTVGALRCLRRTNQRQWWRKSKIAASKNLRICVRDGGEVVDRCHDVAGNRLKVGTVAAVDVAVVDVDVRVAVRTQVFIQHPHHVRQQFDHFAELKTSPHFYTFVGI